MVKSNKAKGIAIAVAAAGLLSSAPVVMAGESTGGNLIHCYGVNKCKGHNDCKTAHNACKGHAACKGQGFVSMSASACDNMGGEKGK